MCFRRVPLPLFASVRKERVIQLLEPAPYSKKWVVLVVWTNFPIDAIGWSHEHTRPYKTVAGETASSTEAATNSSGVPVILFETVVIFVSAFPILGNPSQSATDGIDLVDATSRVTREVA